VLYTVPFTYLLNPQTLAAYCPNPSFTFLLAYLHFLTVFLIADKQQIMEGHVTLKAWSEKIYGKYEYLPLLSVSMLDGFCSLKEIL
jgi:hypothetical protein